MAVRHVNIGKWLFRVGSWDGLLPIFVFSFPSVVGLLLPDNRGAMEITAVALPIAAFFLRFRAGRRHIAQNHCSTVVRGLQMVIFCLGLMILLLIDAVLILAHLMPEGELFATRTDLIVWGILFGTYLVVMTVAMYPGAEQP